MIEGFAAGYTLPFIIIGLGASIISLSSFKLSINLPGE